MIRSGAGLLGLAFTLLVLSGCSMFGDSIDSYHGEGMSKSAWGIDTESHSDLLALPLPGGRISVSVYGFRDQTGQYKPSPASTFSTAVTQGAGSLLVKALWDSRWFTPLEREGLQNLLTERKIVRASIPGNGNGGEADIPQLASANIILEGGIVGYDSNIKTGGIGAKYFGIGISESYRVDQVTVNLRAVDTLSGRVINTVTTTKTVYSKQVSSGVFRFIKFKRLLEAEAGYSTNEPGQIAVMDAIETAVIRLIVTGIEQKHWNTAQGDESRNPVYLYYADKKLANKPNKPNKLKKYDSPNNLFSSLKMNMIDGQGNVIPGRYESDEFVVLVESIGGGMASVTTTDKFTGVSESFKISSVL